MLRKGKDGNKSMEKHLTSDSELDEQRATIFSVDVSTPSQQKNNGISKDGNETKIEHVSRARTVSCTPGDINSTKISREQSLHHLNHQKGKVRIDETVHQIRAIFDKFEELSGNLIVQLHEPFNYNRMFWEFLYNFFHFLAFPLLIYREGKSGLYPRAFIISKEFVFAPILSGMGWILFAAANVVYFSSSPQLQRVYFFPIGVMNFLHFVRVLVIAIKYGYYPSHVFAEYRRYPPVSKEYISSLHLMAGWGVQSPLTMAREFWLSQERLHIEFSKLRLTFRDTKAFNLSESQYCSCSRWATMLDWLVPFVYVFTNTPAVLTRKVTIIVFLLSNVLIISSLYRRIGEIEQSDGNIRGWILLGATMPLGLVNYGNILWATYTALDFTKRFNRVVFCTNLLDPKLESFVGAMKRSYKVHCFAALGKISKTALKKLNLHTIDLYNPDSIYSWSQLRNIILDCGKHFLLREQAYNGVLIGYVIFLIFYFLYALLHESITIMFEDLSVIVLFSLSILIPTMWTLSCANSINWQTEIQKRLLSERIVEMQFHELEAKKKGLNYWEDEIRQAKEMASHTVDILNQDVYEIKVLGIRVDTAVVQVLATLILCLGYVLSWAVYNSSKLQWRF